MFKPLAGKRVLDFTKVLAGPLCTQYLSDLGAEVIKIEPTEVGDETRRWPPFRQGQGAVFLSVNRNKHSLAVDLKTPEGQAVVRRIARTADIAIESFGTGVAERLGIDYAALKAEKPDLVYCSISGFGRTGPRAGSPGYDVILQAFSGVMSLTGEPGGGPIRSPISPIDQTTGMHALSGILAALLHRDQTGEGTYLEVSLFETAVGFLGYNLQSFWERGVQPEKCGSGHESLCPYQAFEASDAPMMIGIANDNLWRRFCRAVGREELIDDPRFRTNPDRVANFDVTVGLVQDLGTHAAARRMVEPAHRHRRPLRADQHPGGDARRPTHRSPRHRHGLRPPHARPNADHRPADRVQRRHPDRPQRPAAAWRTNPPGLAGSRLLRPGDRGDGTGRRGRHRKLAPRLRSNATPPECHCEERSDEAISSRWPGQPDASYMTEMTYDFALELGAVIANTGIGSQRTWVAR